MTKLLLILNYIFCFISAIVMLFAGIKENIPALIVFGLVDFLIIFYIFFDFLKLLRE